jgi:hypothetical protein
VEYLALVDKSRSCLPPLLIKLALINIFVKVMDKEREGFVYLRLKFPKISKAKMKEGSFVGSQIIHLFEDHDFSTKLNATERRAWRHLKTSAPSF